MSYNDLPFYAYLGLKQESREKLEISGLKIQVLLPGS